MIYTIEDAFDFAESWDLGDKAKWIVRAEHQVTGEIREVAFTNEVDFISEQEELDLQGYHLTCYNDDALTHRECSLGLDELLAAMEDKTCS